MNRQVIDIDSRGFENLMKLNQGDWRLTAQTQNPYHPDMSKELIIEDEPLTPEMARQFENARKNLLWFNDHVEELEVYKRYRGKYVGSAAGELFVADTPEEIDRLIEEKYPDEHPHVRYIPLEKRYRIYAC